MHVRASLLVLAVALATPAAAQHDPTLTTPVATHDDAVRTRHAAISTELGFFTYDRERYPDDHEIGVHASLGYRWQRGGGFVEPHVRGLVTLGDAEPGGLCDEGDCAPPSDGAIADLPVVWPGVTAGFVIGDDYFSQSIAARAAVGIGASLHPLVGVRYEGSARWFGWFAELDVESVEWFNESVQVESTDRRLSPTLLVGSRLYLRHTTAPAPDGLDDAGVLAETAPPAQPERYLAVWAQDQDRVDAPFLAMIDLDPAAATYGQIVASRAVGTAGGNAHHTELPAPYRGRLWVNSFGDSTFLLDLSDPRAPALAAQLAPAPGMMHPHTFVRLPHGDVLVTYQQNADGTGPGGLAVHSADGAFLRGGSAADSSGEFVRPYSAVLAGEDRIVTTGADMHATGASRVVQLWRQRDLRLLGTIPLPAGARGSENVDSFEPRVLPDGTVLVVTLGCGLYRIDGVDTDEPVAWLEHTFGDERCFMPAVVGYWWIQTLARQNALEVLDLTNPTTPRVASRLQLPEGFVPHWLAADAAGERIVLTGYRAMERRVVLLRFDRRTGTLRVDGSFGGDPLAPGISLDGPDGPHGSTGPAVPHGAVFVP